MLMCPASVIAVEVPTSSLGIFSNMVLYQAQLRGLSEGLNGTCSLTQLLLCAITTGKKKRAPMWAPQQGTYDIPRVVRRGHRGQGQLKVKDYAQLRKGQVHPQREERGK